jgi:pilus assembly protein Flp/PilA
MSMKILQLWVVASTWFVERVSRDERGATAVEYGIMVALIAAVIVLVVQALGVQVKAGFCKVAGALPALPAGICP